MFTNTDLLALAVEAGGQLEEWLAEFEREFNAEKLMVEQTKTALETGEADGDDPRQFARRLQRMVSDGNSTV